MAFVVEDGTGIANANAYCDVAFVDAYFSDRANAAWTGDDTVKQAAIVKATDYIERAYVFSSGYKNTVEQALSFPRAFATDKDGFAIASNEIPVRLKQAVAEGAIRVLTGTDLSPDLSPENVKSEAVGSIRIEYAPGERQVVRFTAIDQLLRGLVNGSGGSAVIGLSRC